MNIRREIGRLQGDGPVDGALIREARVHFDHLLDMHPNSGWTEFRVTAEGQVIAAVEDENHVHD